MIRALTSLLVPFLLALCARPAAGQGEVDWSSVWSELAQLEALAPDDAAAAPLLERLRAVAEEGGADSAPRAALLAARLARWSGDASEDPPALTPDQVAALDDAEAWLALDVLAPGPERARKALELLGRTPRLSRSQLVTAWTVGVDEARALRLRQGALPIQRTLHELYRADWTAIDLGLTLSRLGEGDALDDVLSGAIAAAEAAGRPAAELWSRWGIAVLGFGDEARARDYLGRALARGSEDAALVLGRLDLQAGHMAEARVNFRPSILGGEPASWALRGWGFSLLPAARTTPKGAEPSAQPEG